MDRFDYLIVGAGFAGSVCAERLASAGKSVLLVDQRNHIGGNAYDYYDDAGVLLHKYGAHVFHTNAQDVVDYLSRFTEWRAYEHRVLSSVNGQLLPVPINRTTLAAFDGDEAAARAAMIEPYTRKQWGPYADELAPTVLARITSRPASDDDRYFTDRFQAMPAQGYTRLFERMLAHPNIELRLGRSFTGSQKAYPEIPYSFEAGHGGYPEIIYTGPVDQFFDYRFGRLPYRSARFEFTTYEQAELIYPVAVINEPDQSLACTRSVEFRHMTGQRADRTTIAVEYPQAEGEPFWPVPTKTSAHLYQQYEALARETPHVHFCGRLGTFRYIDQDQAVAQALKLSRTLLERDDAHARAS